MIIKERRLGTTTIDIAKEPGKCKPPSSGDLARPEHIVWCMIIFLPHRDVEENTIPDDYKITLEFFWKMLFFSEKIELIKRNRKGEERPANLLDSPWTITHLTLYVTLVWIDCNQR